MNGPAWSIKVEDFGPIKSGTVTLAPLTVFVGPNNSGKSYMASLVWMLLEAGKTVLGETPSSGAKYDVATEIARAIRSGEKSLIDADDWAAILAWYNEALAGRAEAVIREILEYPALRLGFIDVSLTQWPQALPVSLEVVRATENVGDSVNAYVLLKHELQGHRLTQTVANIYGEKISDIDHAMLRALRIRFSLDYNGATYIPAARTGLMVAYPILVASLIGSLRSAPDERARSVMPAPMREFLISLQYASPVGAKHGGVASFLEREILGGEIRRAELGKIQYILATTGESLPLHATSSMITELAPFILLLKDGIDGCLIFEEPEAHLHLSAQRTLARALVRLVNAGTPVLITTHSDTFLQQINILMQLHDHPNPDALAAEFGYDASDLLDPTKALGYMFNQGDGWTTISALEKTEEGFVEPLMNAQIADLTHEVIRMEQA